MIAVRNIENNQPIVGAHIYQGSKASPTYVTTTDNQGLASPPPGQFQVSHVGYQEEAVNYDGQAAVVYMMPRVSTLPEVTVTAERPGRQGSPWMLLGLIAAALFFLDRE